MPLQHSVLNVKALVGAFNLEKALVGAFSVIVKTECETIGSSAALVWTKLLLPSPGSAAQQLTPQHIDM